MLMNLTTPNSTLAAITLTLPIDPHPYSIGEESRPNSCPKRYRRLY